MGFKKNKHIGNDKGFNSDAISSSNTTVTQNLCQYDFNGTTQYLEFGDVLDTVFTAATPQFTIEMWIKNDVATTNMNYIGKWEGSGNQRGWRIGINTSDKFQWVQSSDGSSTQGFTADDAYTNTTDWFHLAFTLDYTQASYGLSGQFYVNGNPIDATETTPTKNTIFNSNTDVVLGSLNTDSTPTFFLNGQMKGVAVTNRVKDAAEILADFNLGNGTTLTGTSFYADFKTDTWNGSAWVVEDLSGNNYDGLSVAMIEGSHTCSNVEILQNKILSGFTNSVVYSVESDYSKRSSGSEYNFNYTGSDFWIRAEVTGTATILVLEDGVHTQTLTMVDDVYTKVSITGAYIQLIEPSVGTTLLNGARLKEVIIEPSKFVKVEQGFVVDRFVFLGDSITQGQGATTPQLEGYSYLFNYTDLKEPTVLGFAGALAKDIDDDLVNWISRINSAFLKTTGRKVLTIMLGSNDWADGYSAAAINTRYSDIVDAINVADSDIEVFCISPTHRIGEDAVMTTIRANVLTMCSSRAWCTGIDGTSIIGAPDLADTVHPTTAGHVKIHDAIDSIIL